MDTKSIMFYALLGIELSEPDMELLVDTGQVRLNRNVPMKHIFSGLDLAQNKIVPL